MASLPPDKLSVPRKEVAVVAHQVVRHHHGVDVIARHLRSGEGMGRTLDPFRTRA